MNIANVVFFFIIINLIILFVIRYDIRINDACFSTFQLFFNKYVRKLGRIFQKLVTSLVGDHIIGFQIFWF